MLDVRSWREGKLACLQLLNANGVWRELDFSTAAVTALYAVRIDGVT